ncbi:MAG: aromatic ring-hydroxylating dioxygenase subunit alpha [Aestuariivita sp.]|uniref:aromatic ring-hydroxylating oxygenase subunit alpha n=1 Tax=Aestuariivita sp. TaxID=1872407 RepID=UPI003BB0A9FB
MTFVAPLHSPLLDHCPEGLPSEAYYDPDWFAREQKNIWAKSWICVGRYDQLEPGTMRRIELAGDPVILVRGADGSLSAFHNTCRHRGAELCAQNEQSFNGRLITCPYHAWAYDLRGQLVSTGHATPTDDFDKRDHGLFPVHLRDWNGFVYLCLADTPLAFEPDMGEGALDNWPMRDLVPGHVVETELACNWKIFWENYNECLHCPGIHPELSDLVPVYRKGIMSPPEAPGWSPGDPAGHSLKEGARTWSVTGQPCGPEFPNLTQAERDTAHNFVTVYPSMFVVAHVDYVRSVRLIPLGPERTRLRAEWLFLPETLAQPGFDLTSVTDFAQTVLFQDGAACEMNQRGLRSSKFTTARLMPQEFEIHGFHKWIMARMIQG